MMAAMPEQWRSVVPELSDTTEARPEGQELK